MFVRMPGSPFLEDNRQSDEYVEVYLYNIPHASQFTVSAVNTPQIKPAGISITHRSNLTMIRSRLLWISSFSLMIFQPAVTAPSKTCRVSPDHLCCTLHCGTFVFNQEDGSVSFQLWYNWCLCSVYVNLSRRHRCYCRASSSFSLSPHLEWRSEVQSGKHCKVKWPWWGMKLLLLIQFLYWSRVFTPVKGGGLHLTTVACHLQRTGHEVKAVIQLLLTG